MIKKNPSDFIKRDKWNFNFEDYPDVLTKTIKDCPDLKKINELLFIIGWFYATFLEIPNFIVDEKVSKEYSQKLTFTCFVDFMRTTNCTTFLTGCGLYKNAYHNIRYALESVVQSLYMDTKHPKADFQTKIEILDEVEDISNYRGIKLLKKLEIENKDEIMREYERVNQDYSKLSKKVHFSYRQLILTATNITEANIHTVQLDCNEVSIIYDLMTKGYDLFLFLILTYFPKLVEPLSKNKELTETVKDHNLRLVCKILNIPL